MSYGQLLVVGSDADWVAAAEAAGNAAQVLFYSLEGAWRVRGLPVSYSEIVEIRNENRSIENRAWALTTALTESLSLHPEQYSPEAVEAMRRGLFSAVFKPIEMARTRARRVQELCPEDRPIMTIGLGDFDQLALRELFGEGLVGAGREPRNRVAPEVGAAEGPRPRPLPRRVAAFTRLVFASLRHRWHFRALLRPMRAMRSSHRRPCALVLVSTQQHARALQSTMDVLRARGWRLVLLIPSAGVTLSERIQDEFDATVEVATFLEQDPLERRLRERRRSSAAAKRVVRDWCRAAALEPFADLITGRVERNYGSARLRIQAVRHILHSLKPQVVLSVDETSALVETAAVVARALRIPTVNVQHGVIGDTQLRADFRFDAFCVYGEAYAEVLRSLGTKRERIRTVGNPFLDLHLQDRDDKPTVEGGPRQVEKREVREQTILFAAQHSNRNISDLALHATLSLALKYAQRQEGIQVIVKLHPLGHGKEFGYELALGEHPNVRVEVVREGDLYGMLETVDCVATYSSTVAFDALGIATPVIVVDPLRVGALAGLIEDGVALRATDVDELGSCMGLIEAGRALSSEKVLVFKQRYGSAAQSRSAGARIADVCEQFASVRRHRVQELGQ